MSTASLSELLDAFYPDDDAEGEAGVDEAGEEVGEAGDNPNTTQPSEPQFELELPDKSGLPPCKYSCDHALPLFESVLDSIISQVTQSTAFLAPFSAAATDAERIRLCLSEEAITGAIEAHTELCRQSLAAKTRCLCGRKNPDKAAALCAHAGDAFISGAPLRSMKLYTKALMYAPEDSGAALLYGNRAAIFYHLEQFENALADIGRVTQLGFYRLKLLIRQVECLLRLGRAEEANRIFNADLPFVPLPNTPDGKRWSQLLKLSQIPNRKVAKRSVDLGRFREATQVIESFEEKGKFKPHEAYPWLNAKVDLIYNQEKGLQLITKKKLEYGEIIAIGRPFASYSAERPELAPERCHHCHLFVYNSSQYNQEDIGKDALEKALKTQQITSGPIRLFAPIPCGACSAVLFCSEACRMDAWKAYHRFECPQLAALSTLPPVGVLALRMLYTAGSLKKVQSVAKQWNKAADGTSVPAALLNNPQAYSFVYPMARLGDALPTEQRLRHTVMAIFLAKLALMSGFIKNSASSDGESAEGRFFALVSILLRHLLQVAASSYSEEASFDESETRILNTFVHGFQALLAPSCEPTTRSQCLFTSTDASQSSVQIYHASANLPIGTALTIGYSASTPHDQIATNWNRRHFLRNRFGLDCTCTACERECANALEPDRGVYYPIGCAACGSLMSRAPASTFYRCASSRCGRKMTSGQMKAAYEKVERLLALYRPLVGGPYRSKSKTRLASIVELKRALEETAPTLHRGSLFLSTLYRGLFLLYTGEAKVPIPNRMPPEIIINMAHLTTAWDFALKMLEAVEEGTEGAKNSTEVRGALRTIYLRINRLMVNVIRGGRAPKELAARFNRFYNRLDAINKLVDYDSAVTALD